MLRYANFLHNATLGFKQTLSFASRKPTFAALAKEDKNWIRVVHSEDAESILPEYKHEEFKKRPLYLKRYIHSKSKRKSDEITVDNL